MLNVGYFVQKKKAKKVAVCLNKIYISMYHRKVVPNLVKKYGMWN